MANFSTWQPYCEVQDALKAFYSNICLRMRKLKKTHEPAMELHALRNNLTANIIWKKIHLTTLNLIKSFARH